MKDGVKVGLAQEISRVVTRELCISNMSGTPPVLATAEMIRMMEWAAYLLLDPFYEPGEASVGTVVNVKHLAATPLGMKARAVARLTRFEGRRFYFDVEAFDEKEKIGEGTHERFVIDIARFQAGIEAKLR
jgi:predicted thioesterase